MATKAVINVDLADVFESAGRKGFLHSLAWGDSVEVLETTDDYLKIRTTKFETLDDGSILPVKTEAFIWPKKGSKISPSGVVRPFKENTVLKVNFVDVQQGDAALIETPDGKTVLIDGGDNQMFARYLAARYPGTSEANRKSIDCILVTHGDADHFSGLVEIQKSEKNPEARKRLFISPKRYYHNGIVKRPSKGPDGKAIPDKELLGDTEKVDNDIVITELFDNLLEVPDESMNLPYKNWKESLQAWDSIEPIEFRRLSFGQDDAFDFLKTDGLEVSVLGPILTEKDGISGLKFLHEPPKGPRIGHESIDLSPINAGAVSASHTINGHSIVFRLRYGGFSYLFTGDLNDESSRILGRKNQDGEINLRSEVFKVPHHGSADFSGGFVKQVSPIVSIVSSGDESSRKEYIHPRATLLGALGKHSRSDEPIILVTELVAFFKLEGWAHLDPEKRGGDRGPFFAFSRAAYGLVKTRTDGNRLLVYTDSGKADMKEAYCFELDEAGLPQPTAIVRV